jgi:cation transport ATPase
MKPQHKLWILTVFTGAWIGLWMTGPENPGDNYSTFDVYLFGAVLIICFIQSVRYWSQYFQQRDADKLQQLLKRHDRTRR